MKEILAATCRIVLAWSLLTFLYGGAGLLVRRSFGLRVRRAEDLLSSPWLGWAIGITLLQLWHLVFPVDARAGLVMAALGGLGLVWNGRDLAALLKTGWKQTIAFLAVLSVLGFWLAYQTANQPALGDTALYHLNAVRWAYSYPIVPGLGHLHSRLAFNSSYFLYVAMLDVGPFLHKSHQLAGGLLLLFGFTRSLFGIWRLATVEKEFHPIYFLDALFAIPVLVLYASGTPSLSSPTPDVAVALLQFAGASELLRLLFAGPAAAGERQRNGPPTTPRGPAGTSLSFALVVVVWLSAVCVAVKMSSLAFSAAAVLVATVTVIRAQRDVRTVVRSLVVPAVAGCLVVLPWMVRGVILSGYPFYPSTFCGFPVSWRLTPDVAMQDAAWARSSARIQNAPPEEVMGNLRWLWPWVNRAFRKYVLAVVVPITVAISHLCVLLLGGFRVVGGRKRLFAFLSVPLLGAAFWFAVAPEPRYVGASLWLPATGAMAYFFCALPRRIALALYLTTVSLFVAGFVNLAESVDPWLKDVGPAKTVPMKIMTTRSGLDVYVPREGPVCWDAPLPCTPYFNRRLRLRVEGDMSKGFCKDPRRSVQ